MTYARLLTTTEDILLLPNLIKNNDGDYCRLTFNGNYYKFADESFHYTMITGEEFWYDADTGEFHARDGVSEVSHQSTLWFTIPAEYRNTYTVIYFTYSPTGNNEPQFAVQARSTGYGYTRSSGYLNAAGCFVNYATEKSYTTNEFEEADFSKGNNWSEYLNFMSGGGIVKYFSHGLGSEERSARLDLPWSNANTGEYGIQFGAVFSPSTLWDGCFDIDTTTHIDVPVNWDRPSDGKTLTAYQRLTVAGSDEE